MQFISDSFTLSETITFIKFAAKDRMVIIKQRNTIYTAGAATALPLPV